MPTIETPIGRVFYATRGDGDLTLMCLHGAGGNYKHWAYLLNGIEGPYRVVIPDLPGHGRSAPPGRTSIDAYVEFIWMFMDTLAVEKAILIGHSMGGAIALSAALEQPDRVGGLVLIGSSARLRVLPTLISGFDEDPTTTIAQLVELIYAKHASPKLRIAAAAEYERCNPQIFRDDFAACDGFDLRPRLAEIHQPTLVISGTEDRMVPPKLSAELHAGLPHARLLSIPNAGHMPMIEQPAEIIMAIQTWLR